jgi:hypothetical protein
MSIKQSGLKEVSNNRIKYYCYSITSFLATVVLPVEIIKKLIPLGRSPISILRSIS